MYTILHAIVGYFFLLLVVRLLSRRPGAQLTPFEFVIVFLIGGLIILATVGDDRSVTNCICAIITIGLMHRITSRMRAKYPRISTVIDGVPLVLLAKGEWRTAAMHGMRLDAEDVMAIGRSKGVRSLDGIQYAILERVGTISILPKEQQKDETKQGEEDARPAETGENPDPQASDEAPPEANPGAPHVDAEV